MWLVRKSTLLPLLWYLVTVHWGQTINCLNNRILMSSRGTSRALAIPYDIAETLGVENQVNEPYRFSYKVQDNADNMQFRNEEKTLDGQVKGSYGYKDANGIYRMVNYYSDATGFHAKIISNEPGILPRRDHVNPINRELFAKQTPLAYNPANVEIQFGTNANQPDFNNLNTLASEYNGDWRYNSHNHDLNSLYARENYAFHGGDQYAGAASQVVESRRLNSINHLYEAEKQKLALLVVPKTAPHVLKNSNSDVSHFKSSALPSSSPIHQPISQPSHLSHQANQRHVQNSLHQHQHHQAQPASLPPKPLLTTSRQQPISTPPQSFNQPQPQSVLASPVSQPPPSSPSLLPPSPPAQQQVVRKERRRITGVRRVAKKAQKDQTYFNNAKIEILPSSSSGSPTNANRKADNSAQSDNLSLKEFSTKFPEKWHQIFSNANGVFEDKPNQYAQLEAVAVRPDISVLADQSFMKQPSAVVTRKEASATRQTLVKKIDRVGALPRKSIQYLPPLNSSVGTDDEAFVGEYCY